MRRMGAHDHLSRRSRQETGQLEACLRVKMRFGFFDEGEGTRLKLRAITAQPAVVQHALNLKRCETTCAGAVQPDRQRTTAGIQLDCYRARHLLKAHWEGVQRR